jgi:SAM-dependent methyltransferase
VSNPGRYDAITVAIFLGGSRRLRHRLVDTLEVSRGHRVLELGCGSGQVTEQLVAAGAMVTAVDALPETKGLTPGDEGPDDRRRVPLAGGRVGVPVGGLHLYP